MPKGGGPGEGTSPSSDAVSSSLLYELSHVPSYVEVDKMHSTPNFLSCQYTGYRS